MVYFSMFEFKNYYLSWMVIFTIIFYFILNLLSFFASFKKYQKYFLIGIVVLSLFSGVLVNPIDYGTDVIFESDFSHEVENIVKTNHDALWIVEGMPINNIIPLGAKTINAEQTCPEFEIWHILDLNGQYEDVYNRYAHVFVELEKENNTFFELNQVNAFSIHLNVNDLEKLNVRYIVTRNNNLENFSNDNVEFNEIYREGVYRIFHIEYI